MHFCMLRECRNNYVATLQQPSCSLLYASDLHFPAVTYFALSWRPHLFYYNLQKFSYPQETLQPIIVASLAENIASAPLITQVSEKFHTNLLQSVNICFNTLKLNGNYVSTCFNNQ
jgi:hypothetical protein